MRIRNPPPTSTSATPPPSPSSSNSSPHSSTVTFTSSACSSQSSSPSSSLTRCQGLDLLVKAILHVSAGGSVVGVPYIQRRSVIRRRRRSDYLRFNHLFLTDDTGVEAREKGEGSGLEPKAKLKKQRRRRTMALPSKYHDSVLQPWRRRGRSAIKIND